MSLGKLKSECHTLRRKIWNFQEEKKRIESFLWIRRHIGTSLAHADLRKTQILKKLLQEKLAGKHCSMHLTDNRGLRRRRIAGSSRKIKKFRQLAVELYGLRCASCGRDDLPFEQLTLDHINPVFKGGQTEIGNIQLLCEPCHNRKSNKEGKEASKKFWENFDVDKFLAEAEKVGEILNANSN